MILDESTVIDFRDHVWQKGRELYRDMPWRDKPTAYYVVVSELMLQQTQVSRVIPKFEAFTTRFPDFEALARAEQADVVAMWSGLGYNRRARFLHQIAKKVVAQGGLPDTVEELIELPGIGKNTAGAIAAYVYDAPVAYVETNIRTVLFHELLSDQDEVSDVVMLALAEQTLDREHPRQWYWALMDYGAWLKRNGYTYNARSRHYKKQTPLKGSVREVRGAIVAYLSGTEYITQTELDSMYTDDKRLPQALAGLLRDGLIVSTSRGFRLTK